MSLKTQRTLLYTKGTSILCPNCKGEIGVVARDLFRYDRIDATMFKAVSPQIIANGARVSTHCCNVEWIKKNGLLFTKNGWATA